MSCAQIATSWFDAPLRLISAWTFSRNLYSLLRLAGSSQRVARPSECPKRFGTAVRSSPSTACTGADPAQLLSRKDRRLFQQIAIYPKALSFRQLKFSADVWPRRRPGVFLIFVGTRVCVYASRIPTADYKQIPKLLVLINAGVLRRGMHDAPLEICPMADGRRESSEANHWVSRPWGRGE
jgi:hypothetical protein